MQIRESIARATATARARWSSPEAPWSSRWSRFSPRVSPRRHDGLQLSHSGGHGGAGGHHPAPCATRSARLQDQLAPGQARPHAPGRPPAAWLGSLGARRRRAAVALDARRNRDPRRARRAGAQPRAGLLRQRRAPGEHHGAPGVRPDRRGVRPGGQRSPAGERTARLPAKADKKQLDKVNKQEQQLQQQQGQQEQQLPSSSSHRGCRSSRPKRRRSSRSSSSRPPSSKLDQQEKKQASSPATDPRLTNLEKAIENTKDVDSVSPATVDKRGTTAVLTVVAKTAPSDPGPRTSSTTYVTT